MATSDGPGRRGPAAVPVDAELRRLLRLYVNKQAKATVAAAQLGVSPSTLARLLSGRSGFVARATHARIIAVLGLDSAPPPADGPGDSAEACRSIGEAMWADSRGDHFTAASRLARISEQGLDTCGRVGLRLARARNALARGDAESAEYLLAGVVSLLKGQGQRITLARAATELALVCGQRQKVAEAVLAFQLAERALLNAGTPAAAFLVLVRQAFLNYALRIGKSDEAARLLREGIRVLEEAEGPASLSAQIDSYLLEHVLGQLRPSGSVKTSET